MANGERTAADLQALQTPGNATIGYGGFGISIPAGLLAAAGVALGGGEEPTGSAETLESGQTIGYGDGGTGIDPAIPTAPATWIPGVSNGTVLIIAAALVVLVIL